MISRLCLSVLYIIMTAAGAKAQDVVIFRNGTEVAAKIIEVGTTEIKYKKHDNPDGPTYTVTKAEVSTIEYENGTKEEFKQELQKSKVRKFVIEDSEEEIRRDAEKDYIRYTKYAKEDHIKGIVLTSVGAPMLISGVCLLGVGTSRMINESSDPTDPLENIGDGPNADLGLLISGIVFTAIGIPLTIAGPVKLGSAKSYRKMAAEAQSKMAFEPMLVPVGNGSMAAGASVKITF